MLRVRKFGRYAIATFKGPVAFEGTIKTREEVQTGVESFELAIQLFDTLGYKPVFRYQKYREVWRLRDVEVVIDRTPIGDYFEIEGPMDVIRGVADQLGMPMDSGIRQSYADLYRQYRRTRADLPEHMVFPADQLPAPS
jgi:adenylate cyclase class 2